MSNKKTPVLSIILFALAVVCACFGLAGFNAPETAYAASGDRYGNINWKIEGQTLTISPIAGTDGAMADITSYDKAPWYYVDGKYSCDTIKSIIIEDGVSHIGTEAFCYFDKITKIVIPESCKCVSREAFYNCENLKEAIVYGDVGVETFAYCYALEKVTVIDNAGGGYIAEKAFYDCENLKEATLCATHIEDDAFCYCYALEKLTLNEGCVTIANEAFYKCRALTYLTLPSTLLSITREAFYDCRNLKQLTYNGSASDFTKISFDTDYNDPVVEALNCKNGRETIYKAIKTYGYINEQGANATLDGTKEDCYYLTTATTKLKNAWYIVNGKLDFDGKTIAANGNVKILLLDDCGIDDLSRIELHNQDSLYIYSESLDESKMGYINATARESLCPAIGNYNGECTVNICGGNITANGGNNGAGIGSGYSYSTCQVNIYNGKITANGGNDGAGIGSGADTSSAVNIYGGTIKATGGVNGAGIGSGSFGNCTVKVFGGTINAKGGECGAGIGSGSFGNCTVCISDGNINAISGFNGASIGSGFKADCTVTLTGGYISAGKIGAGYFGTCQVYDYRSGKKGNGAGTLMSGGSLTVIFGILAGIALITAGVFMFLYFKNKKKNEVKE